MRGVLRREWFQLVDTIPAELSLVRYWDTAYQKKTTSDFTVGVKYGIARNGVGYILHVARTRATPHEVETFIANVAGQDSRNVRVILQQEPGSGSALWIDAMQRGALLGYPVYADHVRGSKFERSQPFRAAAEAGNLKLLRGAWNEDFLEECEQFSSDEREYAHDDQVDAACGAFNYLTAPQRIEWYSVRDAWKLGPSSAACGFARRHNADEDRPGLVKSRRWGPGAW